MLHRILLMDFRKKSTDIPSSDGAKWLRQMIPEHVTLLGRQLGHAGRIVPSTLPNPMR